MVDYREILRYSSLGYSRKQISLTVHSSHHTVEDTLNAAQEKGIAWPLDDDITDADLQEILFPGKYSLNSGGVGTGPHSDQIGIIPGFRGINQTGLYSLKIVPLSTKALDSVLSPDGCRPSMLRDLYLAQSERWMRYPNRDSRILSPPARSLKRYWVYSQSHGTLYR